MIDFFRFVIIFKIYVLDCNTLVFKLQYQIKYENINGKILLIKLQSDK